MPGSLGSYSGLCLFPSAPTLALTPLGSFTIPLALNPDSFFLPKSFRLAFSSAVGRPFHWTPRHFDRGSPSLPEPCHCSTAALMRWDRLQTTRLKKPPAIRASHVCLSVQQPWKEYLLMNQTQECVCIIYRNILNFPKLNFLI